LTRLQHRKLYQVIKKRRRTDHRTQLYLLFDNWVQIRKQKDRRRRKTQKKLYIMRRCEELNIRLTA